MDPAGLGMRNRNPPPPRGPALDPLPGPSFLSLLYRLYPFYIFSIAYILSIFYIALLYLYIFYIFYIAYPKYLPNPPLFFGGRVTRVILAHFCFAHFETLCTRNLGETPQILLHTKECTTKKDLKFI